MPHRSSNVVPIIKRRLNGIALVAPAADALEESQVAEDSSATDVINRALQIYNALRKERHGKDLLLRDCATGETEVFTWDHR